MASPSSLTTLDSMPSVADVTQATSSDTGSKESVARQLFRTPPSSASPWEDMVGVCFSPSMDAFDNSPEVRSTFGSEANTVNSLDLAVDLPSLLRNQENRSTIWETLREQNSSDSKVPGLQYSKSLLPNDSPKPSKRAKLGSAHRQPLAHVFSMFDSSNNLFWPPRPLGCSDFQETTPGDLKFQQEGFGVQVDFPSQSAVAWRPKAESLERECTALKEIIRVDNFNILNLKKALENLDRICKQKTIELDVVTEELQASKQWIESLEACETDLNETISNLKKEVDRLNELDAHDGGTFVSHKADSVAQLRFENELFASQIVESEAELRKIRVLLEQKQSDNIELKGQLEGLEPQLCVTSIESQEFSRSIVPTNSLHLSTSLENDLLGEVEYLSAKLKVMEGEKNIMKVQYEEELHRKDQEIEEIVWMVRRAKERQDEQAKESLAHRNHETAMITHVSTMDQELECLQQTLREKNDEIDKLKSRVPGKEHQASSGLCGFSNCLFS